MKKSIMNRILTNHWVILYSVILAIIFGIFLKDFAKFLQPFANFYLSFLKISVIPIVIITVTTSISTLINQNDSSAKTKQIFTYLLISLIACSFIAVAIGGLIQPGEGLSKNPDITELISQNNTSERIVLGPKDSILLDKQDGLLRFFEDAIPSNIFESLSQAKFLQIVFFGVIFGLALGYTFKRDQINRSDFLKTYLPPFEWINEQVIYFLPVGIFLLIATQVSQMQAATFLSLYKLAIGIMLSMLVIIFLSLSVIAYYAKKNIFKVLIALSQVCLVALSTRSTFACVPKAIEAMTGNLKFDQTMASLVISFGSTTCRYGTICFYCVSAIFVANIFDSPLTLYQYGIILIVSILTAISSSGAVGVVSLQMLALVLEPLGLPLGTILILLIAIDPITDMFDTVANILGNCAVAAACSPLQDPLIETLLVSKAQA